MPNLINSFLKVPDCSKKQYTLPLISISEIIFAEPLDRQVVTDPAE